MSSFLTVDDRCACGGELHLTFPSSYTTTLATTHERWLDGHRPCRQSSPAAPEVREGCWCVECNATGRQNWLAAQPFVGMVVCPDCGDKRCPRASSHTEPCQRGSDKEGL